MIIKDRNTDPLEFDEEENLKRFYFSVGHRTQNKEYVTPAIDLYQAVENSFLHEFIQWNDKVLDMGCGEGRQLEFMADRTKSLVGIDFALNALKVAKSKNDGKALLVHADATNLPFINEYFTKIVSMFNTIGTVPNNGKALSEAYRVLKKDGQIAISVYSKEALQEQLKLYKKAKWKVTYFDDEAVYTKEGLISHRYSLNQVSELLKGAGFKNIEIIKLTPISWIAVGMK